MSSEIGTIECTLGDMLYGRDGSLVVTLQASGTEKSAVEKIYNAVRSCHTGENRRLLAQFQWHKEKRSVNANAYFHTIVGKIAKSLNESEEIVKKSLVTDYGTQAAIIALPCAVTPESAGIAYSRWLNNFTSPKGIKCAQYAVYKPTHTLDTAEMSRLIDGAVSEAKQLGIETKTPEELDKIKSLLATNKE